MQQKGVDLLPIGPPSAAPLERDEGGVGSNHQWPDAVFYCGVMSLMT